MKKNYGYLIAYTDVDGENYIDKNPWIYPTNPLEKEYVKRECKFLSEVAKVKHVTPFMVNVDKVPDNITWKFVEKNKVEL